MPHLAGSRRISSAGLRHQPWPIIVGVCVPIPTLADHDTNSTDFPGSLFLTLREYGLGVSVFSTQVFGLSLVSDYFGIPLDAPSIFLSEDGIVDVSILSMYAADRAKARLLQTVELTMLKKAMDTQAQTAAQLLSSIPKPPNAAANPPNLGQNVDTFA